MKLNPVLLAKAAGVKSIDPDALVRLEQYADLLAAANRRINLISRASELEQEIKRQIVVSLLPLRVDRTDPCRWIDIGSGGGFPVVPLAIVEPHVEFIAVEAVAKKAYFIERTAQEIGIANLRVIAGEIERVIAKDPRPECQVVSIKAVADLPQSLAWAGELLVHGGLLFTYKPGDSDLITTAQNEKFEQLMVVDVKEVIDITSLSLVVYKKR